MAEHPSTAPERPGALGLVCAGLRRRYGHVRALDGLDLVLGSGESMGLVGRNGVGKSTLFRCIVGADRLDSGAVQVQPPMSRTDMLQRVGYVPDTLSAPSWMRVRHAIEYVRALQPRFDPAWARELTRVMQLDERARVRSLSRGMQARLACVLGLSHWPELLLLDEPLLGVDAVTHDTVLEVLAGMRARYGCTILMASHNMADMARLVDRLAFVEAGRVVEIVDTDHLMLTTKRVVIRPEPAPSWSAPAGTLLQRSQGGALTLTVRECDAMTLEALRVSVPGSTVEVIDLSVNEACADRLRAMEAVA